MQRNSEFDCQSTRSKDLYQKELNKEDIERVSKTTIEKEEVLYYIEAKTERKKASYSTKVLFDKNESETLQKKAISFVNKVKQIIEFTSF